jgi:IS30 family transposase
MSDEEKATIWRMTRAGANWRQISTHLDRHFSSVHNYARWHGGVPPRPRRRAERQLTLAEREEVSRGLACGESIRRIAAGLGRAPSTISREVARNGGSECYRASAADLAATERARRPKVCKLAATPRLRVMVEDKLRDDWSPEQISLWLRRAFPDDPELHVSHETIYLSLFVQARGLLRKELTAHLRTRRMIRRGKTISNRGHGKGQIVGAVHISERPAEVEDRAVPGHWEGDMLIGSGFTQIATLVERQSRFVMLVALPSRSTDDVVPAVAAHIQTLPEQLRKTLTWDRGNEMAKHAQFTVDTGVQVYFCDPRSPWQRGTNENTNGLLRQYFPKRTTLAGYNQADLDQIAAKLNRRPRKTLDGLTPAEKINQALR